MHYALARLCPRAAACWAGQPTIGKIYPSLSPGVVAFNGKAFEQGGERSANGMDRLLPRRLSARNRLGAGTFAGPHGCLAHSRTEVIASKWRQAAPAFAQIGIVGGTIVGAG